MALSKKLRFEVFKRDGFTCQYCGGHPPNKVLEADHVIPKSKGGKDDINNLVTSCFECNRGKSNNDLSSVPPTLSETMKMVRERESQYREYQKLLKNVDKRINQDINDVEVLFRSVFEHHYFSEKFRISVKKFIDSLGIEDVKDSMERAICKIPDAEDALKYFCGICWSKIKGPR